MPIPTDLFFNGEFNGASCGNYCILLNSIISHNNSAKFFTVNINSRDVRSYSRLNISGTFYAYNSGDNISELMLGGVNGAVNKSIISVSYRGTTGTFSLDISQVLQFNSDCYLKVDLLRNGISSDWTTRSRITHIWLS